MKPALKAIAFGGATVLALPCLVSFLVRSRLWGRERAFEGSSQALSLLPGILGQYVRRAFYARTLAACHRSVTIEFGTLLSKPGARLDENVYVGPACHLGLVHLERDVLVGPGVHIPSGPRTHGTERTAVPMRGQPGARTLVRVGAGAWVGSNAVVMADVGAHAIVGAGAVVTAPVPEYSVVGGVPARVLESRR